jgi:hypothetical protein
MNMKMYVPRCTVIVRATFRDVFKLKISKETYMYYYTVLLKFLISKHHTRILKATMYTLNCAEKNISADLVGNF